jgi:hypothetical protein
MDTVAKRIMEVYERARFQINETSKLKIQASNKYSS